MEFDAYFLIGFGGTILVLWAAAGWWS